MHAAHAGFNIIEVVVVLTLLGILMSIGVAVTAPGWSFARDYSATVTAARERAVVQGRSTAVGPAVCPGAVDAVRYNEGAGVVLQFPPRGLLFTPDGLPRTCDGGGVGNTTILLEYRGRQAAVIVSSLGRVRWEMR